MYLFFIYNIERRIIHLRTLYSDVPTLQWFPVYFMKPRRVLRCIFSSQYLMTEKRMIGFFFPENYIQDVIFRADYIFAACMEIIKKHSMIPTVILHCDCENIRIV